MTAKKITDASFNQDVLQSPHPVLVDFYADWCGPCRAVGPILDQLAAEKAGKVVVAKLNIDENPNTPSTYGVRSIPTMILFVNGVAKETKVGATTKQKLSEWLDTVAA